eukprot:4785963-Lingulodinium_polyedra.AAC.1
MSRARRPTWTGSTLSARHAASTEDACSPGLPCVPATRYSCLPGPPGTSLEILLLEGLWLPLMAAPALSKDVM